MKKKGEQKISSTNILNKLIDDNNIKEILQTLHENLLNKKQYKRSTSRKSHTLGNQKIFPRNQTSGHDQRLTGTALLELNSLDSDLCSILSKNQFQSPKHVEMKDITKAIQNQENFSTCYKHPKKQLSVEKQPIKHLQTDENFQIEELETGGKGSHHRVKTEIDQKGDYQPNQNILTSKSVNDNQKIAFRNNFLKNKSSKRDDGSQQKSQYKKFFTTQRNNCQLTQNVKQGQIKNNILENCLSQRHSNTKKHLRANSINKLKTEFESFIKQQSECNYDNDLTITKYFEDLLEFYDKLSTQSKSNSKVFNLVIKSLEFPISKIISKIFCYQNIILTQQNQIKNKEPAQQSIPNQQNSSKELFSLTEENVKLKAKLAKIQKEMQQNRSKDAKFMQLLYAMRKMGIDIEGIYNENVVTPRLDDEN